MGSIGMTLMWETKVLGEKPVPFVTLSTPNPTWNGRGLNPGFRGEKSRINHLSNGTVHITSRCEAFLQR